MKQGFRDSYYTISEFSNLCGLSRQTLIYYDRIGVFSPAHTSDENGYRYYGYWQYEVIEAIIALKEMGTPLQEIKQYLSTGTDAPTLIDLLRSKGDILREEARRIAYTQKVIENKVNLARQAGEHPTDTPWLEWLPERYYLMMDFPTAFKHSDYTRVTAALTRYCRTHSYGVGNTPAAGIAGERLRDNDYLSASYFCMLCPEKTGDELEQVAPAGLHAMIYHQGEYQSAYKGYARLLKFIKEQGLVVAGGSHERQLLNFISVKQAEKYINCIDIPVMSPAALR